MVTSFAIILSYFPWDIRVERSTSFMVEDNLFLADLYKFFFKSFEMSNTLYVLSVARTVHLLDKYYISSEEIYVRQLSTGIATGNETRNF